VGQDDADGSLHEVLLGHRERVRLTSDVVPCYRQANDALLRVTLSMRSTSGSPERPGSPVRTGCTETRSRQGSSRSVGSPASTRYASISFRLGPHF
jgi:hypothetical protein